MVGFEGKVLSHTHFYLRTFSPVYVSTYVLSYVRIQHPHANALPRTRTHYYLSCLYLVGGKTTFAQEVSWSALSLYACSKTIQENTHHARMQSKFQSTKKYLNLLRKRDLVLRKAQIGLTIYQTTTNKGQEFIRKYSSLSRLLRSPVLRS